MKLAWKTVGIGFGIGAINGVFGGGGGMLAVPALEKLGLKEKQAHATAILVILPVCALSLIPYLFSGAWDFSVTIPTSLGVLAGGVLGASLLSKLSGTKVTAIFSILQAVAGAWLLFG
jgi:uncharacterized membrane protein YfcA